MSVDTETLTPAAPARQGRRAPRLGFLGAALIGLVVPALGLLLWEIGSRAGWLAPHLFPAPSAIAATVWDLARDGTLGLHIWMTLQRVLLGFFFGVLAATVLGALTGYSSLLRRLLDPTLQALRSIPSIAWVPLFILWFGIFELSKVVLIAVGVFFPVYLSLASGILNVDRKLVEVGRIYRFSPWGMIRRILLPAVLPTYVIGLRSGLGLGWMFVVAAEFMGASEGLGYLLIDGQQTGRAAVIIASIILFAIMGKLTDKLLAAAAAPLLRWQDSFKPAG